MLSSSENDGEFDLANRVCADIFARMNQTPALSNPSIAANPAFQAGLDASPALMRLSDTNFGGVYFNNSWRDFTGRPLEQELDAGWLVSVHPDDIERLKDNGRALIARKSFQVEYRLLRHDGVWRWMLDTSQPHFASDGKFLFYVGSCIDISDRKQAEETRIRNEERLKLAQEAAKVGTYDWDFEHEDLIWSPEMFALYGIDPTTAPKDIYPAWLERLHPEDRARADAETNEFVKVADELSIEFRINHPQNGERWIQGRGRMQRDPEGRPLRMIGVNFDVTEQRRAEADLREGEQRVRDIAENFPGIIYRRVTYPDGTVEYPFFSGTDETLMNLSQGHGGMQTIEEISKMIHFDDLDEMLAKFKYSVENLSPLELEGRVIKGNAETIWVRSITRPRPRADGALVWDGVILNVTEQHQRRAERERAATMLRMSMDVAGLGTWEYNPSEATIRGSKLMNVAFGIPENDSERPLADYMQVVHPDDRPWVESGLIEVGKKRESASWEFRVIDAEGEIKWVNSMGTFVQLADGTERVIGAMTDVTARKRQEAALLEASGQMQAIAAERTAILSQLTEGVIVTDEVGKIVFVNEAAAQIHGTKVIDVAPEEFATTYSLFTLDGRPYPSGDLPLARAVVNKETVVDENWLIKRPDGKEVVAIGSARPVYTNEDRFLGGVLTLRDDTARHAAEEALSASERKLNAVLSNAKTAVVMMDERQHCVYMNEAAEKLTGYSFHEVQGRPLHDVIHHSYPDGRPFPIHDCLIDRAFPEEQQTEGEEIFIHKDGHFYPVAFTASPLKDADARAIGTVIELRDIRLEKEHAKHVQMLIDELNHRVKNTLATVQSIVWQALRGQDAPPHIREAIETRLTALARSHDLLTRQEWRHADLVDIVHQAIQPFGFAEGRADRFNLEGASLQVVPKSALAIAMAFHELATNAVKYGALSTEAGRVLITWEPQNGHLNLTWREVGGPRVEEPSRKGFGLRLIERGLAYELNGEVALEFLPDGLQCRISFPISDNSGTAIL